MSERLGDLPEPLAWMTHESKFRLVEGGNAKGSVPVHGRRSVASTIRLYTDEQMQRERERCFKLGKAAWTDVKDKVPNGGFMVVLAYSRKKGCAIIGYHDVDGWIVPDDWEEDGVKPSHWMHLPEGPGEAK